MRIHTAVTSSLKYNIKYLISITHFNSEHRMDYLKNARQIISGLDREIFLIQIQHLSSRLKTINTKEYCNNNNNNK